MTKSQQNSSRLRKRLHVLVSRWISESTRPHRCSRERNGRNLVADRREIVFAYNVSLILNAKRNALYDLTSTYFECDPPEQGIRKFGYSRDKRSDCVQVVIALIVTPEGFPLAYEVMPGNTKDSNTLLEFLEKIEKQYGKANRTWIMDRGIPTEETIEKMKQFDPPVSYLVGTPKGRLTELEKRFLGLSWEEVRKDVNVKLLKKEG